MDEVKEWNKSWYGDGRQGQLRKYSAEVRKFRQTTSGERPESYIKARHQLIESKKRLLDGFEWHPYAEQFRKAWPAI